MQPSGGGTGHHRGKRTHPPGRRRHPSPVRRQRPCPRTPARSCSTIRERGGHLRHANAAAATAPHPSGRTDTHLRRRGQHGRGWDCRPTPHRQGLDRSTCRGRSAVSSGGQTSKQPAPVTLLSGLQVLAKSIAPSHRRRASEQARVRAPAAGRSQLSLATQGRARDRSEGCLCRWRTSAMYAAGHVSACLPLAALGAAAHLLKRRPEIHGVRRPGSPSGQACGVWRRQVCVGRVETGMGWCCETADLPTHHCLLLPRSIISKSSSEGPSLDGGRPLRTRPQVGRGQRHRTCDPSRPHSGAARHRHAEPWRGPPSCGGPGMTHPHLTCAQLKWWVRSHPAELISHCPEGSMRQGTGNTHQAPTSQRTHDGEPSYLAAGGPTRQSLVTRCQGGARQTCQLEGGGPCVLWATTSILSAQSLR